MVDLVRMPGVIDCVVADSHGFIHPHLTFQAKKLIVWLRVDEPSRNAFKVKIEEDDDVFDALETIFANPLLDLKTYSIDKVTVKFNDQVIPADAPISQYCTSAGNPLLLELPEPEGKLHAVTYLIYRCWGNHVIYILVAMVLSQAVQ